MYKIFIILTSLLVSVVMGNELNLKSINTDSEIKIVQASHEGISFLVKSIDGKEKALNRIEFIAICSNGFIKIKKSFFTGEGEAIVKEEHRNPNEYLLLWKDIINIGLEDLASLPLEDAVDPFEFIDSWRIDQDTIYFDFKVENRRISFNLYDIESYRDKRFQVILKRIMAFFGE